MIIVIIIIIIIIGCSIIYDSIPNGNVRLPDHTAMSSVINKLYIFCLTFPFEV